MLKLMKARVHLRVDHVRGHEHADVGPHRRRERQKLDAAQLLRGAPHHRQRQMGIGLGVAMPREVLAAAAHPAGLHAAQQRQRPRRRRRRLGAQRAVADDRVVRVGHHVAHRRVVEVEAERAQLAGCPALAVSLKSRSFYFTLLYSSLIVGFGLSRIRRRKTPYVKRQTLTLMAFQVLPLFLLPELILPWLGYNG